jgi:uncharacterized protein
MPSNTDAADVQIQWELRIPMRDGVHLAATLYLPTNQPAPCPAIFTLVPYIRQVYHDRGVYFASHGHPFLTIDVRGRGDSEGTFAPLVNEARDGHDIVEWLARQPYCNGKVAMWGGSYMGYAQWATASQRPLHLATIVPVASSFLGVDVPMRNNIHPTYTMQWLTFVSGRASQDKMFADKPFWRRQFRRWLETGARFSDLDRVVGNPSAVFQEWIAHERQGEYWDRLNPTPGQYAKLSFPILTITGSYDGDQPGALTHYREHLRYCSAEARARHYLIIGPWDHAGTRIPVAEFDGIKAGAASVLDLPKLHREWYAWTLQDGQKPEFLRKNVAYYVLGADVWRYTDTLDAITARTQTLYLHSSGAPNDIFNSGLLLSEPQVEAEPDRYIYDPRDVSLAELESEIAPSWSEQRLLHASISKQLFYHTKPFEKDTEISGFFRFSAWLSIDQPDTDFKISIYEVDSEGGAILLSADWMRARYRNSFREEELVRTRAPLLYDFRRFTFISRKVKLGNRLRLVVGPINSIHSQKNYNSGGVVSSESMQDARTVTVALFHDRSHQSLLFIPLGQEET